MEWVEFFSQNSYLLDERESKIILRSIMNMIVFVGNKRYFSSLGLFCVILIKSFFSADYHTSMAQQPRNHLAH